MGQAVAKTQHFQAFTIDLLGLPPAFAWLPPGLTQPTLHFALVVLFATYSSMTKAKIEKISVAITAGQHAKIKAAVGHDTIRVVRPNQPVTMDFREDRLNVDLNASDTVTRVHCV